MVKVHVFIDELLDAVLEVSMFLNEVTSLNKVDDHFLYVVVDAIA